MDTSMIIDDLDVLGVPVDPAKAQSPLAIDPDRVLAFPRTLQPFQTIPGRRRKIVEARGGIQQEKLPAGDPLDSPEPADIVIAEQSLCILVGEGADHIPFRFPYSL
jgi:hypothetical protein